MRDMWRAKTSSQDNPMRSPVVKSPALISSPGKGRRRSIDCKKPWLTRSRLGVQKLRSVVSRLKCSAKTAFRLLGAIAVGIWIWLSIRQVLRVIKRRKKAKAVVERSKLFWPPIDSNECYQFKYAFGKWNEKVCARSRRIRTLKKYQVSQNSSHFDAWEELKEWDSEWECDDESIVGGLGRTEEPQVLCGVTYLSNLPDCLVYSFTTGGIGDDFEASIKDLVPNCQVHKFDKVAAQGRASAVRAESRGYIIHDVDLKSEKDKDDSTSVTIEQAVKLAGHIGRRIDVIRVDCDACEWDAVWREMMKAVADKSLLLGQLLVKLHLKEKTLTDVEEFYVSLDKADMRVFHNESYRGGCAGLQCIDYSMLSPWWGADSYAKVHCPTRVGPMPLIERETCS